MNYYAFISLFNGLVALLLGLYVFVCHRQKPLYRAFGYFVLSIAGWAIAYSCWQVQTEKETALLAMRITMAICYFIPPSFLWFVRHLIEDEPRIKWPALYLFIPLCFALTSNSPLMIADVAPKMQFLFWPVPGKLFHFAFVIFNGTVIYALFLLINAWRTAGGPQKWQLQWISLCMVFTWGGGLTNWFLWYDIPIPPVPNFFVAVFLLLIGYGVARKQLFDIGDLANIVQEAKLSAIGMLTTSMNHEIRNPLYVIKGHAESFLSNLNEGVFKDAEDLAGQAAKAAAITIEQTERAIDIMKRFSQFAKQGVPRNAEASHVDVALVLDMIISLVEHELSYDKIKLSVEIDPALKTVLFDTRHLEEILFNLVVNACQALKNYPGERSICIAVDESRGIATIRVSDTGPGLSESQAKRVFDPFFSTKEDGTGLGLYIAKRLAERNGSTLVVDSKPGLGTTFSLGVRRC